MLNTREDLKAFQTKIGELGATMEQDFRVIVWNLPTRGVWWESLDDLQKAAEEVARMCKALRENS